MRELEKMIEKYWQELVEFSKQKPIADEEIFEAEEENTVPAMANALPFVSNAGANKETDFYKNFEDFQNKNPSKGSMRVQVSSGGRSYPIINAIVKISVPLETGDREIYSGYTDINGIVDNIVLPAPDTSYSLDEKNTTVEPYATYEVTVTHPEFAKSKFFNVPVFANIKAIQPARLVPLTETGGEPGPVNIAEQPMRLYGGDF